MEADISQIVNMIMEKPELVEQIRSMASSKSETTTEKESVETQSASVETQSASTYDGAPDRTRRNQLLCALKPYLSESRARAVDSMMSIADILDVARKR